MEYVIYRIVLPDSLVDRSSLSGNKYRSVLERIEGDKFNKLDTKQQALDYIFDNKDSLRGYRLVILEVITIPYID